MARKEGFAMGSQTPAERSSEPKEVLAGPPSGSRCIVLLSGGLDSTVTAALVAARSAAVLALTVDYGQLAAGREIEAARSIAAALGCQWRCVALPWLGELGGSALTDATRSIPQVPDTGSLAEPGAAVARARAVWVPNRNGLFVAIAGAFADALDFDFIALGLNRDEGATFPDNTVEFALAAAEFLAWSTLRRPVLLAPTAQMSKAEIVRIGLELGAPLRLVWSCYGGGGEHCWSCESCARLRCALEDAGAWPKYAPK
ncbi:MAG: 7-cyano-7-deazaguanine synthase QueC [Armatimonadetes bacterium]|nr:7-cyano-7-deazaguanine synthase QueC [Armatimonadota bacterium]